MNEPASRSVATRLPPFAVPVPVPVRMSRLAKSTSVGTVSPRLLRPSFAAAAWLASNSKAAARWARASVGLARAWIARAKENSLASCAVRPMSAVASGLLDTLSRRAPRNCSTLAPSRIACSANSRWLCREPSSRMAAARSRSAFMPASPAGIWLSILWDSLGRMVVEMVVASRARPTPTEASAGMLTMLISSGVQRVAR